MDGGEGGGWGGGRSWSRACYTVRKPPAQGTFVWLLFGLCAMAPPVRLLPFADGTCCLVLSPSNSSSTLPQPSCSPTISWCWHGMHWQKRVLMKALANGREAGHCGPWNQAPQSSCQGTTFCPSHVLMHNLPSPHRVWGLICVHRQSRRSPRCAQSPRPSPPGGCSATSCGVLDTKGRRVLAQKGDETNGVKQKMQEGTDTWILFGINPLSNPFAPDPRSPLCPFEQRISCCDPLSRGEKVLNWHAMLCPHIPCSRIWMLGRFHHKQLGWLQQEDSRAAPLLGKACHSNPFHSTHGC